MVQLPHVLKHVQHISGTDFVVFNPKAEDLHSDSLQSIPNGSHSLMTSPIPLKPICQPLLITIPGIPQFSGTEREKILFSLNSGTMLFQMPVEISVNHW